MIHFSHLKPLQGWVFDFYYARMCLAGLTTQFHWLPRLLHFSTLNYPIQLKLTFQNSILSTCQLQNWLQRKFYTFWWIFQTELFELMEHLYIIFRNLRSFSHLSSHDSSMLSEMFVLFPRHYLCPGLVQSNFHWNTNPLLVTSANLNLALLISAWFPLYPKKFL